MRSAALALVAATVSGLAALTPVPGHAELYTQDTLTPPTGFHPGWHEGTEAPPVERLSRRRRIHSRGRVTVHRRSRPGGIQIAPQRAPVSLAAGACRLPPPRRSALLAPPLGTLASILRAPIETVVDGVGLGADRAYLVATSCPGDTMERQGPAVAVGRLNPVFVRRLAAAVRDARAEGIEACIFSAYRPPGYGVGGFRDKFMSAHAYGLAVDMAGIGPAGSKTAIRWREIAAIRGVYGPYSVYSRSEWNHMEPSRSVAVTRDAPALRGTITSVGPKLLATMWEAGKAVIAPIGLAANVGIEKKPPLRLARAAD